jgi:hypothetical protein
VKIHVYQSNTTKGTTTKQKIVNQACPTNVKALSSTDREVSSPHYRVSFIFGGKDDYNIQTTLDRDIYPNSLLNGNWGARLETSSSVTNEIGFLLSILLIETIRNFRKEIRKIHTLVNCLMVNVNTVCNQNYEIRPSYKRIGK